MGVRGVHAVRVYRGGPNGIAEATALTLVGPDITSSFGAAVGAGDVDGDGYADVIVGAPDANAGAGAVHVYSAARRCSRANRRRRSRAPTSRSVASAASSQWRET